MGWIKNLFSRKREYHGSRLYDFFSYYVDSEKELSDFFSYYVDSEKELSAMKNFIRENNMNSEYWECGYYRVEASKTIRKRYGLYQNHVGFVWYLLEQFYKGNITIKKDVQSESGGEIHS